MAWIFLSVTFKGLALLFQLDYKFLQHTEHHSAKHRKEQRIE